MSARVAWCLALFLSLVPLRAYGEDTDVRARARALYDGATAAAERGEYAAAARLFAEADRLSPTPIALKSALRAALLADDPVLGMELVSRAEGRELPPDIEKSVEEARSAFSARVGQVRVRCPSGARCRARVDGRTLVIDEPTWIGTGTHLVEMDVDGRPSTRQVEVTAGGEALVEPPLPPRPRPVARKPAKTESEPTSGLHPAWFGVAAGLSAALAAGSIASAVDTKNRWDTFQETGDGAEEGRDAQLRTNVLFFTTIAVHLGAAALGIFGTDWNGRSIALEPTGARIRF
jgi:hypothetical protein